MKIRKIKYRWGKDFGFKGEPRNCGKYGRKRSYGHWSGMPSTRSMAEKKNAAMIREDKLENYDDDQY